MNGRLPGPVAPGRGHRDVGRADEAHAGPWTTRLGRAASERPLPWLLASLVFVANAVLSATRADWWLAGFAGVTGLLAGLSALSVAARGGRRE